MTARLKIRDTGYSVTHVLELISEGRSYQQIRKQMPGITQQDIREAARAAHDFIIRHLVIDTMLNIGDKTYAVSKISVRPNRREWSTDDKREMISLFTNGADPAEIARILMRSEEEINDRLRQNGLIG
ncbi:MAG: DUF433 domain-containing protein [candidate division Zixibacteria bacterium]|nr:DUF433 domain-containing protein [candidate division Zixibacteria bacterium]